MTKKLFHLVLLILIRFSGDAQAAVILQYHHVSDSLPSVTSISADAFTEHMHYLADNDYKVIALNELITTLQQGQSLPDKTLAITFDDGFNNNFSAAAPILEKFGYPYTIFVNPELIDKNVNYVMSWDQLRQLANKGALIANHSGQHDYLHRRAEHETQAQWQARIKRDITHAQQRIKAEIGHDFKYLAYPYGEFNRDLQTLVKQLGFVGIGQHSGAVSRYSDFTRLPRFPASGRYSNLDTLKTKLNAQGFAIAALDYQDTVTAANPPAITITLSQRNFKQHQFACYVSGGAKAKLQWLNENKVHIIAPNPLPTGRSRYNCTAPVNASAGHYFWFSQPWVITQ